MRFIILKTTKLDITCPRACSEIFVTHDANANVEGDHKFLFQVCFALQQRPRMFQSVGKGIENMETERGKPEGMFYPSAEHDHTTSETRPRRNPRCRDDRTCREEHRQKCTLKQRQGPSEAPERRPRMMLTAEHTECVTKFLMSEVSWSHQQFSLAVGQ